MKITDLTITLHRWEVPITYYTDQFGGSKQIARAAQALPIRPWPISARGGAWSGYTSNAGSSYGWLCRSAVTTSARLDLGSTTSSRISSTISSRPLRPTFGDVPSVPKNVP